MHCVPSGCAFWQGVAGGLGECFFFSSRGRHTIYWRDWSSDVCSSDLGSGLVFGGGTHTLTASSSITGGGTVSITTGTVNEAGTYNIGGVTQISGGTVNFSSGQAKIGRASCRKESRHRWTAKSKENRKR